MKVLIVGAGGVGTHSALALAAQGCQVVLASRTGRGLATGGVPNSAVSTSTISALQLDAAERGAIANAARGVDVIVNALNPPYTRWAQLWPPIANEFVRAAETSGAGLLTFGNLYSYGEVDEPMSEQTPVRPNGVKGRVRAEMWADALTAHRAGQIRAVEVRASDYFGPGASPGTSFLNEYVIKPTSKGKRSSPPMGVAGAPHSWAFLPDIGVSVAAVAQADQRGPDWGRPWHVPCPEPRSMAEVAAEVAETLGLESRGVKPWRSWVRTALKPFVPIIRELDETAHQFERPFIVDATAAESRFDLRATSWPEAIGATLRARGQVAR